MIPRPPLSFILDGSDMLIAGRSLPVFFARFSLLNQELKLLPQAIRAALARGILKLQESHLQPGATQAHNGSLGQPEVLDRKSTRLNSSHANISYAVFCLNK